MPIKHVGPKVYKKKNGMSTWLRPRKKECSDGKPKPPTPRPVLPTQTRHVRPVQTVFPLGTDF